MQTRVALYYVKPKTKKGPSAKGWLLFLGGMVGLSTGAVIYIGKLRSSKDKHRIFSK